MLDGDDHYCLSGARLIKVGTIGNNVHFRLERDTLAKIIGHKSGSTYTQFVVYEPDGNYAVFGKNPQSQHVMSGVTYAWHVEEAFDRYDNSYRVTYNPQPATEIYPTEITYAHHPQVGHRKRIVFDYSGSLPRPQKGYFAGHEFALESRLEAIEVYLDNTTLVRRFELTYGSDCGPGNSDCSTALPNTLTTRDVLKRIKTCDGDGVCMKGTRFEYTPDTNTYSANITFPNSIPIWRHAHLMTDVDGDGKDDFVFAAGISETDDNVFDPARNRYGLFVRYATFDSANPGSSFFGPPVLIMTGQPPCSGSCNWTVPIEIRAVDWDRDGGSEIAVRYWRDVGDARIRTTNPWWYLYAYPGDKTTTNWTSTQMYSHARTYDRFADADGDGLADVFHCNTEDNDDWDGVFEVNFLAGPNAGQILTTTAPCVAGGTATGVMLVDLDGDGSTELLYTDSNGTTHGNRFTNRPTQTEFDNSNPFVIPNGPDTRRTVRAGRLQRRRADRRFVRRRGRNRASHLYWKRLRRRAELRRLGPSKRD